jgi:5-hydroxyisourate hydrolase
MARQDTPPSTRRVNAVPHTISTHVLDTESGQPAAGVPVYLARILDDGTVETAGAGHTDADGRIATLLDGALVAGVYRLTFEVREYRPAAFFAEVSLDVVVDDIGRSYHVPLLLAPYGISSYRGS